MALSEAELGSMGCPEKKLSATALRYYCGGKVILNSLPDMF